MISLISTLLLSFRSLDALAAAIGRYQESGCWNGNITISRELYEKALEVSSHDRAITRRHPCEEVVVPSCIK